MIKNILTTNLYINNIDNNYSKIILEPLEQGFGHTIGNSIRRILLSSIPGYAITEVEIEDVLHEYSGKNGIKEDIIDILLNLKELSISLIDKNEAILILNKSEIGEVKAKDIISKNCEFKIYNPEHIICNITKNNINLNMKMKVKKGKGYVKFSNIKDFYKNNDYKKNSILGKLFIDAIYNPIENVSYKVEATRFENHINLDKLIIDIKTNGSISPEEAVKYAVNLLINKLNVFENLNNSKKILFLEEEKKVNIKNKYDSILSKSIDNLDLTVRSYNCLKSESIFYIGELIKKTESELLKISNLGKKSLLEIKEVLLLHKLHLGTDLKDWSIDKNNN